MKFKNTKTSYGIIAKIFHWLTALTVFFLFGLGLWMIDLNYYDNFYHQAPHIHQSIGILLFFFIICRIFWRLKNPVPKPLKTHSKIEKKAAHLTHIFIYILLITICLSGYLITTSYGKPIAIFNWFKIPASISHINNQADYAGLIHKLLSFSLIALVALHIAGALKHHFIDKDKTLRRMLK